MAGGRLPEGTGAGLPRGCSTVAAGATWSWAPPLRGAGTWHVDSYYGEFKLDEENSTKFREITGERGNSFRKPLVADSVAQLHNCENYEAVVKHTIEFQSIADHS